ncbi:MAG TPA: hypothetical protein IGS40_15100 [Trichormus sp. M33_DOE_039]|nr:hypothetical protein [Trichormus sp. M33_DOE_039]
MSGFSDLSFLGVCQGGYGVHTSLISLSCIVIDPPKSTPLALSRETRRHLLQVGHCPPNAVSLQRSGFP